MSDSMPSVADAVRSVNAAHVAAGVPWRSARPVRRPAVRPSHDCTAFGGPPPSAAAVRRPAHVAGLRHTSVVDWAAVAARLAAAFPPGDARRAEYDRCHDATITVDAANGSSVCILDPNYRGGLI